MPAQLSSDHNDQIIEDFERGWNPESSGSAHVFTFVTRLGCDPSERCDLVTDLIQIDIERAWQWWCKMTMSWFNGRSAREVKEQFLRLPRLEAYVQHFPFLRHDQELLSHTCRFESEVRATFGDAIGPMHYQEQFGVVVPPFEGPTVRRIAFIRRNAPRTKSDPMIVLYGYTVMGRQRSNESCSYSIEPRAAGGRVVIADRNENRISREHLAIQLVSPHLAVIENLSKVNAMPLISAAILLEPQESISLKFPITIQLPSDQIVLA